MLRIFCAALMLIAALPAAQSPDAGEVYTPAHIRKVAATDYPEAIRLTDEGLRLGQFSAYEANVLRSNITYQYTEDYATAAEYLRRALEQDEAADPAARTELLYHLATILRSGRDFTALLETCAEGKECAVAAGLRFEEHAFDFLAGSCLFSMGEDEDGLDLMKDALDRAVDVARTEADYGHLIYFTGTLLNDYIETRNYARALTESSVYEKRIGEMEKRFPATDPAYLDRTRFYLYVNRAICQVSTGEQAAAEESIREASTCDFANTSGGKTRMISYYSAAGEPGKILQIYAEDLPFDGDTVSRSYRVRLARLREAYSRAGLTDTAMEYDARYNALSELIEAREREEGMFVKAAEYNALRYRLQRNDAVSALERNRRTVIVLAILFLLVVFGTICATHLRARRREEKLHEEAESLKKDILSLQKQVSVIAERETVGRPAPESEQVSLVELVEGRKLYLDRNLSRDSVVAMLGLSQAEMSRLLDEIQPGLSFPEYIKGLRIRHALSILGQNPDISISDLADQCGFSTVRTLQRTFLAVTGKTPSEYAKDLKRRS